MSDAGTQDRRLLPVRSATFAKGGFWLLVVAIAVMAFSVTLFWPGQSTTKVVQAKPLGVLDQTFQPNSVKTPTKPARTRPSDPMALLPPAEQVWSDENRVFSGCNEARAAGRTNIPITDPAYHPSMDGDGDGLACEPHRRR